jgi:hypothetical protein
MSHSILVNKLSVLAIMVGASVFLFSAVVAATPPYSVAAALFSMSAGLIFLGMCLYSAFIMTPRTIELMGDVLVLNSYFRTKRTVRLEDIEYLVVNPPDPPEWRKRYVVGGRAGLIRGRRFVFTREIGEAIRTAYFEKTGRYPPTQPASTILKMKLR